MTKIKIQIKNRWTGSILFEYEKENNTMKDTLQEAVKIGINLRNAFLIGADLSGIDLGGIDLGGINLREACLRGAYLVDTNLADANLVDANLKGAYLVGACLRGAYLRGAYLRGAYLVGTDLGDNNLRGTNFRGVNLEDWGKLQDTLTISNIGSREGYTNIYKTDKGLYVQCGCFRGSLDEFVDKVKQTHQGNNHERDYLAMVEFAKIKLQ